MMEVKDTIIIFSDFGATPGARYRKDGKFSGEQFLDELLEPKFLSAKEKKYLLFIDLDGVWGYPSSFVSGSFGKLSIKYGADEVLTYLQFKSDENQLRLERIIQEIRKPKKL